MLKAMVLALSALLPFAAYAANYGLKNIDRLLEQPQEPQAAPPPKQEPLPQPSAPAPQGESKFPLDRHSGPIQRRSAAYLQYRLRDGGHSRSARCRRAT